MLKLAILYSACSLGFIRSAKILAVFPTPSYSHQIVFRPLILELVRQGHQVTFITTDPIYSKGSAPINLTEIDIHDQSYQLWQKNFVTAATVNFKSRTHRQRMGFEMLSQVFEELVKTKEVQGIIQKKMGEYDLLLLEACVRLTLAFSYIFKVPVIQISSLPGMSFNYQIVGSPTHPFLYPSLLRDKLYNLTKWNKLQQFFYNYISSEKIMMEMEAKDNILLKKLFGSDIPTLHELANNVDLLFLNVHPIWIDNQPVPSNVVFIGGIHKQPPDEIPTDLLHYLNESTNGFVYISFGTNINSSLLPPEKMDIITKVLSKLPYNVLWKRDKEEMPAQTNNIKYIPWVPQKDILMHPNIKLFITQCGLQSTEEAINAGVPLIGIPVLGDQFYNAEKYVYHGIGIKIDLAYLSEEIFSEALETILNNNSYRENLIRLRNIMNDQPESALQRAIWWINYTLRHGGAKHLRARGANITWAQYLELELILSVLFVLLIIFALLGTCVYYLSKLISTDKHIVDKNKQA